mgnify:CR=1 FL=1
MLQVYEEKLPCATGSLPAAQGTGGILLFAFCRYCLGFFLGLGLRSFEVGLRLRQARLCRRQVLLGRGEADRAPGRYSYRITAIDESGNLRNWTGTYTVAAP